MPNITITTTTNLFKVDFGDLCMTPGVDGVKKGVWRKDHLVFMNVVCDDSFVQVLFQDGRKWAVSHDGVNGLQIDSIDGVAPTSNDDLYQKLVQPLG